MKSNTMQFVALGLRIVVILVTATVLVVGSPAAHAQLSEFDRQTVAAELRAMSGSLSAENLPILSVAKLDVIRDYDALNQHLSTHASPENWAAWLKYIDAVRLIDLIDSGKETSRDLAEMGRESLGVQQRLVGLAPGLERQTFRDLRDSVDHLVGAIRHHDSDKSLELLGKQMIVVAELIENLDGIPMPDDEATITALIGLLQESRQASSTIANLRSLFAKPNVTLWIHEGMVQQVVQRSVDEQTPVVDCILGTRILGSARLTGAVTAELLPSIGSVRMRVQLSGCVNSINKGYNGPVVLRTSGIGQVYASRELTFNDAGIQLQPVTANVSLRTEVNAIEHRLRIVRRIASKKAAEQKPQADTIAKQKLLDRVAEEFARQTNETANVPTPDIMAKVRPMLQRLDLPEPPRRWGSTDSEVLIHSTFCRDDQIATSVSAPPLLTTCDAAIQIHESVVNNAVAPILAGRTLNEAKLNELMSRIGNAIPEPSSSTIDTEAEPPFEIDFSNFRPIIFEARDQRLRIGVRGTRFAQGARELKRAMEITAVYAPATALDGKMILVREGEVDVDFPGDRRLTVAQAGLKGTIKKKFADVFPPILLDEPLTVPQTIEVAAIRGRVFRPCLIAAENGWLSIAVR